MHEETRKREFVRRLLDKSKKEKEKEKTRAIEIIDLTRPDPTFSQKGIFADSVREAFGLRGWEVEAGFIEEKFYRFDTKDFEASDFLAGRKRMWDWMVGCVEGPEPEKKLFCSHILKTVDKYDVAQLLRNLREFLNVENFSSVGKKIEQFFTLTPRQKTVFSYISRVRER